MTGVWVGHHGRDRGVDERHVMTGVWVGHHGRDRVVDARHVMNAMLC